MNRPRVPAIAYQVTGSIRYCARGCITPRRHATDCPDRDTCDGCLPRPAEHGALCHPCHTRLDNLIKAIPGQHHLLLIAATPSGEQKLTQETTAKIRTDWRTSTNQRDQGPYARAASPSAEAYEPARTAALDAAQMLSDWLAETVERLVQDYQASGPARLATLHEAAGGKRLRWRQESAGWEPLVVHGRGRDAMRGEYVWEEPPPRFAVDPAVTWLRAQLTRLEHDPDVGDIMEQFADLMSRCHALAPWREQVAMLKGIPCRKCHRTSLCRYGGDDFVTCLNRRCRETYSPGEYAIWTRMLADERKADPAG